MTTDRRRPTRPTGALQGRGITRRDFVGWSGRLGLASPVLLTALGGLPAGARAAETPRRGGTLVMVIAGDPPTVNPAITTGVPDVTVGSLVYEGLTRIDENFRAVPNLAKSWTVSEDGLRYSFDLVEAKWQDGQDFTSADVKFSLEQVSAQYGSKFKATASHIKSIETPDPRKVVIELNSPFGPFLFSLSAYTNASILPEHVFKGTNVLDNPATLSAPIGTGPFMLTDWARGDHITLKRNPNYWRSDRPYLDQIIIKEIPDGAGRVLALKAGEVDYSYFYFFPVSHYAEVAQDPRLQIREHGVPEDHLIIFNVRQSPFDNVKVRQALMTALDLNYIKKVVFQDLGNVMRSCIDTRLSWAYNPEVDVTKMYPYSPEKANAMLDEAGFKADSDGKRFDLRLVYDSTDVGNDRLSQVLKSMWGAVGVNVVFQGSPRNVELQQVFTDWDFDATLQAYTTAGDPALGVSRLYVSSAIQKRPFVNASGYSNPEVDKLFEQGANATKLEDRGKAYKEVQTILARDLPVFPLWETAMINVGSTRLHGKWAWSTGYSFWEEVWISEA